MQGCAGGEGEGEGAVRGEGGRGECVCAGGHGVGGKGGHGRRGGREEAVRRDVGDSGAFLCLSAARRGGLGWKGVGEETCLDGCSRGDAEAAAREVAGSDACDGDVVG